MRHLPNLICGLRILLVWPIVVAMSQGESLLAVELFTVAAVSDGLDGFLAKRYNWTSQLGKFLDPLADKLLLVAAFITASWIGLVPVWLAAAAIARDVMIGLGAIIFRLWFGPLHGRPTVVSKINTLLQLATLLGAMLAAAVHWPPLELIRALAVLTFITTVASGADYLLRFIRRGWSPPLAGR
jgi:cardiolipin synthase